jgi:L-amino acid N-acyltransferase YncA
VTLARAWKDLNYVGGKTDTIRAAAAGDAVAITAIYNEGIAERVATFETRPGSAADVARWFEDDLPLIVAVAEGGAVVGFARVSQYSDRCVYEGVGEHGVYVARAVRGRGLGRRLLEALCAESEAAGLYKLTSRIFTDNGASRAVHMAAGFEEVGVQRRHGRLDGEWKDCVLVERLLGEAAAQN